jgi:hypothetical protein
VFVLSRRSKTRTRRPSRPIIEADVQGRSRVRQGADADAIDAGLGDVAQVRQRDAAGRLQQHARRDRVAAAHCLAQVGGNPVVEQDYVGIRLEGHVELGQVVHLDLQGDARAVAVAGQPHGLGDEGSRRPQGRKVVVLDEDAVE